MGNSLKLVWDNKRKNNIVQKYNYEVMEQFGEGDCYNLLYLDDNLRVLQTIYDDFGGKIKLIYIDPPYNCDTNFYYQVSKFAFKDKFDLEEYIQDLYVRLDLMRGLLRDDGFIVVHLDYHASHYVKVIMDELFGSDNFRNEIILRSGIKPFNRKDKIKRLFNTYQILLLYSKKPDTSFKQLHILKIVGGYWEDLLKRTHYPPSQREIYEIDGIKPEGNLRWKWPKKRLLKALENYEHYKNTPDEELPTDIDLARIYEKKNGRRVVQYFVPRKNHMPLNNNWMDIVRVGLVAHYPTEKNEKLLARIIEMLSEENDIVADFYCGSGTTLSVAEKLNRRWIGGDISDIAINLTKERILNIEGHKPFKTLKRSEN